MHTIVVAVHDTGIVEYYVQATPFIETLDYGFNLDFFRDVALHGGYLAGHVRCLVLSFSDCLGQCWLRDICHEDGGAFAKEEDGRLQPNAADS